LRVPSVLLGTRYLVLATGFMESVLGRYRNLIILVGVLFLQLLGLAVQVKRTGDAQSTRLIRIWAVDAVTPFERVFVRLQDGATDLWHSYFYLRGVRAENRTLKEQIEKMRLDQVRLNEDAAQAHRLQSLLAFKEQYIAKTVAAQVIGSSGSDISHSVYIDKGSSEGLAPDMAVITAGGIVGKVLRVYPTTSLVLMINDQSSGVGVLLEKSRLQCVLRGTSNGELMLEHVMSDETVSPGETVVSSGGDQIFPKGLPVGTVTSVKPGKEMFLSIKVKPAADLGRVEEVLVVAEKQERAPAAEETSAHIRAADILAQRLPSVPDKPATPPASAGQTKPSTPAPALNAASAPKAQGGNTAAAKAQPAAKPAGATGSPAASVKVQTSEAPPEKVQSNDATNPNDVTSATTTHSVAAKPKPATPTPDPTAAVKPVKPPPNPPSGADDDPH
jgi:rod shape-determining protein MreC